MLQEDADAVGLSILSGAHMTLVPKVVDVLAYPLIGAISDRASHRTGYRTGLMLSGPPTDILDLVLALAAGSLAILARHQAQQHALRRG